MLKSGATMTGAPSFVKSVTVSSGLGKGPSGLGNGAGRRSTLTVIPTGPILFSRNDRGCREPHSFLTGRIVVSIGKRDRQA